MRSIDTTNSTPIASAARNGKRPAFGRQRLALLAGASGVAMGLIVFGSGDALARALNGGGGGGALSAPNIASDAAARAAAQAAAAAQQTQQSLARAARAVQDMHGIQAAARAAAAAAQMSATAPIAVPNGLVAGGLDAPAPQNWIGANKPTDSVDASGRTQVRIEQTTQKAILDWKSFNVGARTTLTFDQKGNANWVALNRVNAQTGPSQILGNIKADGHVYVINQSGIIFGGNSQINVGALIASTAKISNEQFLASGIYSTKIDSTYTPSFTEAQGKIVVESGALITTPAPKSVTSGGGFVLLLGNEVVNSGSITTPKGQAVLAAGDDFILRKGVGTDGNLFSTTRGSEVAPVFTTGSSGVVTNNGLMFAQQGDVTLAGLKVRQDGV
jgi:filamentous hemagglutinin family protein